MGDMKKREYCPALKSLITAQGTSKVVPTQVSLTLSAVCPSDGQVSVEIHIFSSNDGKSKFDSPSSTHKVQGSCQAGGSFTGSVEPQQYRKQWQQFLVENTGSSKLEGLAVIATLHGT